MIIGLNIFQGSFPNKKDLSSHHCIVRDGQTKTFQSVDKAAKKQKICTLSHQLFSLCQHSKNPQNSPLQNKEIRDMALQLFGEKYSHMPGSRGKLSRLVSAVKNGVSGFGFQSSDAMLKKMLQAPLADAATFQQLLIDANAGDAAKLYEVAIYYRGDMTPIPQSSSFQLALEYFVKAADLGHVESQYIAATDYVAALPADKVFDYCKNAADAGHTEAQFKVGLIYRYRADKSDVEDKEEMEEQMFKYFKMAADGGHTESRYLVSDLYKHGVGVVKNEEEAARYAAMYKGD